MRELTNDQILHHLRQNTIGRNRQLTVLAQVLNSAKENTVLAIDGPWGSGKTVFIKQLLMLADNITEDYGRNDLDEVAIEQLHKTHRVYYFNAWENDYLGDALSAILLKLIATSDEGLNEAAIKRAFSMIDPAAAIKNLSHDFIDMSTKTKKDNLVENVRLIIDRHDAVNEFLDELKNKADKERIIFVIDELDRCKPSFAVDLLEAMKHYFIRNEITFILATNTRELAHTIQKYYGYNFDGYAYLNKFFDFTFDLRPVEIERYTQHALSWVTDGMVVYEVAHDAINYLGFEMREINAYHSALRLVDRFLSRNRNWQEDQWSIQLIFVPLALALKIKNDRRFSDFINGKGSDVLRAFLPSSDSALRYGSRLIKDRANLTDEQLSDGAVNALVSHYEGLFIPEGRRRRSESLEDFHDVVSLMSSYTTVAETEGE